MYEYWYAEWANKFGCLLFNGSSIAQESVIYLL